MGRVRLAAVYGGGSLWGIGYGLGVARALSAAGMALEDAPSVGTSAGAWVATAMHLDTSVEDLAALEVRPPCPDDGVLEGLARRVFGSRRVPGVRAVAVRTDDLDHAVLLDGARLPAAQLVAASSAVPGFFVPVTIDGHGYMDGMVARSCTHAHLAPAAERLVVIAPMASEHLPAGRDVMAVLSAEIDTWSARHPGARVDVWAPDRCCADTAGSDLFDMGAAREVFDRAQTQVELAVTAVA